MFDCPASFQDFVSRVSEQILTVEAVISTAEIREVYLPSEI